MTKKKALKMINELKSETNKTNVKRQFWMDKVQGYTRQIFGKEVDNIALPMFHTYYFDRDPPYDKMDDEKAMLFVDKLKEMFDIYLEFIESEVFEKKNIFSNDTNGTILTNFVAIVICICFLIWYWAYSEGQRSINIEKRDMQIEIKKLNDSLSVVKYQLDKEKEYNKGIKH